MAIPFDYSSEYKRKLCTPDEAARVIKSGDWIDISMGGAFPSLMDAAIARRKEELRGVKVRGYLISQPIQMVECDPSREHFIYNSWHLSGYERKLCDKGLCNFIPMVFRNLGAYYSHFLTVNVAMMCVTPMNEHGYFNFSVSNASARAVLDKADIVILEINENLPWVYGGLDECIHISDVNMIVEGDHGPLPNVKSPAASEAEMKIAEFVVQNMVDGSTLQLGIGSMPSAIGKMIAESDLKDLGVHTEMYVDAFVDMAKAGRITGACKPFDKGRQTYAFAAGTKKLYEFLDHNPECMAVPVSYANDIARVSQIDNFISINGAVDIDLYGQVSSESSGTRHISGAGGQQDFVMGAYLAKGGKSFICCSSSYMDKKTGQLKSRIRPTMAEGTIITATRTNLHWLVTEYGKVNVKGLSTWERAEALIGIAHPQFREELIAEAEKMHIWRRSNKK